MTDKEKSLVDAFGWKNSSNQQFNGMVSKKLHIYSDRLEYEGWRIPFKKIKRARLNKSFEQVLPFYQLVVETEKDGYLFHLSKKGNWKKHLDFAFIETKDKLPKLKIFLLSLALSPIVVVIVVLIMKVIINV